MVRTRFRSDQGFDEDFLTEQEGAERFVFKDGYGTNDANVTLQDGYTLTIDGYAVRPLTVSVTSGNEVFSVGEIEFNDAYGFSIVDLGNTAVSGKKVRIDFGSAFNPIQIDGQSDLDASGEEPLEIIQGTGMLLTTNPGSSPKSLTISTTLTSGTFSPVVKLGTTTQTTSYNVSKYSKFGNVVTVSISLSFTKSGTGNLTMTGLPFTSDSTANFYQTLPLVTSIATSGDTYGSAPFGDELYGDQGTSGAATMTRLAPGSTTLTFLQQDTFTPTTEANLVSPVVLTITGSYFTN